MANPDLILAPPPGGFFRHVADWLDAQIQYGTLMVRWPDGGVSRAVGSAPGPDAEIHLRTWRPVRRLIFGGVVGLAESYMDGDWDSPDLASAVELGALHRGEQPGHARTAVLARTVRRLHHRLNANTRAGSRRNIAHHYDLGNAFYAEWLDPSMLYSGAVFDEGANSLEAAQNRKCRRLLDLLDPKPGEHILEIGCGWGGFAALAARERGVKVTGITISQEQHDFAKARIHSEGLAEKVDIRLVDYRDLNTRFDHVASIEMFEAVGEEYWALFFDKLRESLKVGGRAAMQIITIDDRLFDTYRRGVDFIQRYIFPGGMLPTVETLKQDTSAAGLSWLSDSGFGRDYALTLKEWRERFNAAWPVIQRRNFDEKFKRMWNLYLAYCEGGFRAGNIDVRQVQLRRP